jgi:hypothetical protein
VPADRLDYCLDMAEIALAMAGRAAEAVHHPARPAFSTRDTRDALRIAARWFPAREDRIACVAGWRAWAWDLLGRPPYAAAVLRVADALRREGELDGRRAHDIIATALDQT